MEKLLAFSQVDTTRAGSLHLLDLATGEPEVLVQWEDVRIGTIQWLEPGVLAFAGTRETLTGERGYESAIWRIEIGGKPVIMRDWMPQVENFLVLDDGRVLVSRAPARENYLVRSEYEPSRVDLYVQADDGAVRLTSGEFGSLYSLDFHPGGGILFLVIEGGFRPGDDAGIRVYDFETGLRSPWLRSALAEQGVHASLYDLCRGREGYSAMARHVGWPDARTEFVRFDAMDGFVDAMDLVKGAAKVCETRGGDIVFLRGLQGGRRYEEIWWGNGSTGCR